MAVATAEPDRFADVIYRLRLERGLTQKEFARLIGFGVRTLQNWEHGRSVPHISNRRLIAGRLKIDVRGLMTELP